MSVAFTSGLPAAHTCRVLVLGDLILDEFWRGCVRRLSPEAPVPVLDPKTRTQAPGGAANVAINLQALGCEVSVCGVVGADAQGDALLGLLESGIHVGGVVKEAGRPTSHKLRLLAEAQHLLRIDREQDAPHEATVLGRVIERVRRALPAVQGVICSDYCKGLLQPALLQEVMAACARADIPVFVDPKGLDFARYRGATVLTPNVSELGVAARLAIRDPAQMRAAAAVVLRDTQAEALLVTCGKDGMELFVATDEGAPRQTHIAAHAREVFDVTGAGDTVVAALALARLGGLGWEDAARVANVAAGLVVGKLGTASVTRQELLAACDAVQGSGKSKLMTLGQAQAQVERLRKSGGSVVFTNGCFDLLHAGHVKYLQAARALGGFLLVGLNADVSVRALKGPQRPLLPQAERAFMLAALQCVDAVVLFDSDTPAELIAALQPDVLVKGEDYVDKEVVGRDVVEARGGHVALMPLHFGRSTTGLVQTIIQRYGRAPEPATVEPH